MDNDVGTYAREHLALVLETERVGVWDWDLRTDRVWWSDGVEQLFGLTPGSFDGTYEAYLALVPAWDLERVSGILDRARSTGEPFQLDHGIESEGGEHRWLTGRGRVTRNASGEAIRMTGIVTDITDLKRAQERLRQSEERFRAFAEASFEGITFIRDGRIIDANDAALDMLGYSLDELREIELSDLIAPQDRELVLSRIRDGYQGRYVHRAIRKDGTTFEVEVCGRSVSYRGRPARMTALRDRSETVRSERVLKERDDTIRAIVETSTDWIWSIGVDGLHDYSNPAIQTILGHPPEAIVGRSARELLHEDDAALAEQTFAAAMRDRRGWRNVRLRWRHRDGSTRLLESSAVPILGDQGELLGFRGVDRDITDRVRIEEQKVQLEGQLAQAAKMEAVGQLAGGIAHDLNNLLQVVIANVEFGRDAAESGQAAIVMDSMQEIAEAADRGAALIRQLLTFSRRQAANPRVLDLGGALRGTERMLRRLLTEDIHLSIVQDRVVQPVFADVGQFEQVLMNLAVNARDAMPSGGELVLTLQDVELDADHAARHPDVRPGPHVLLSVRDSGTGMDQGTVDRIFEPFFTTKSSGHGTGLGLSIVYGIVKQSGGHIEVISAPGAGTDVRIFLPATHPSEEVEADSSETALPRGGETILLCEDEARVRELAARVLRDAGYTVIEARDPVHAKTAVTDHPTPVDLLVTDVIMPRGSGPRLAQELTGLFPDLRVLFMSGYTSDLLAPRGMDPEIELLAKPFTRAEFLVRVRQILDD